MKFVYDPLEHDELLIREGFVYGRLHPFHPIADDDIVLRNVSYSELPPKAKLLFLYGVTEGIRFDLAASISRKVKGKTKRKWESYFLDQKYKFKLESN